MGEVKIPKEGIVRTIIETIVSEREIESQSELAEFIREKLRKGDEHYTISEKRARLIALDIPDLVVHIETKEGEVPEQCPCCGGELGRVYMRNLKGERILSKLVCNKCPYEGKQNKWIPKRYVFSKRKE